MNNPIRYQHGKEYSAHDDRPVWLSEQSLQLPGWPGFRTKPGRSGYDPVDIYAEYGHMAGVLLLDVIKLRLPTKNFLTKILLVCASLIYLSPLIFIIGEFCNYLFLLIIYILLFSPYLSLGVLLLINLLLSLKKK